MMKKFQFFFLTSSTFWPHQSQWIDSDQVCRDDGHGSNFLPPSPSSGVAWSQVGSVQCLANRSGQSATVTEAEGLLLNGSHLVVPVLLWQEVFAGIHFGEGNCVYEQSRPNIGLGVTNKFATRWPAVQPVKRIAIATHLILFAQCLCRCIPFSGGLLMPFYLQWSKLRSSGRI